MTPSTLDFLIIAILSGNWLISFLGAFFYSVWRANSNLICSICESSELIPEDTYQGKQKIEEVLKKTIH